MFYNFKYSKYLYLVKLLSGKYYRNIAYTPYTIYFKLHNNYLSYEVFEV